jgi:HEAT repeat protein
MLSDSSPDIRVAALNALGKIARKETGPAIEAKLNDPDPRVRGVAAQVYQKLRAQEGREPGPNRGN